MDLNLILSLSNLQVYTHVLHTVHGSATYIKFI